MQAFISNRFFWRLLAPLLHLSELSLTNWQFWRRRQRFAALADYDEPMLADMGLTKDDIAHGRRLPLSVNAAVVMRRQAARQRRLAREAALKPQRH